MDITQTVNDVCKDMLSLAYSDLSVRQLKLLYSLGESVQKMERVHKEQKNLILKMGMRIEELKRKNERKLFTNN